jgi:hypothetical protein
VSGLAGETGCNQGVWVESRMGQAQRENGGKDGGNGEEHKAPKGFDGST